MIKESVTVKDVRELKRAVRKKYDTIILEGEIKQDWLSKVESFNFKKKGIELSGVVTAVGIAGSILIPPVGIPVLIGGIVGSVIFKDAIKHYELSYDEETKVLKLLYYKG